MWLGSFYSAYLDDLSVPAKPIIGDSYPEYICENTIFTHHQVIDINKEISVPLGTFSTTVLYDNYRKNEYWNEKNGLILIEKMDENGVVKGRYEATSRNV